MKGERKLMKLLNSTYEDRLLAINIMCTRHTDDEIVDFFRRRSHKKTDIVTCWYAIPVNKLEEVENGWLKYYQKGKDLFLNMNEDHIILDRKEEFRYWRRQTSDFYVAEKFK